MSVQLITTPFQQPSTHFHCTTDNGKLVGIAQMWFMEKASPFLCDVTVIESHRRRGYGKMIVSEAQKWCVENKKFSLTLNVRKDNEAALNLYWRCGFIVTEDVNDGRDWRMVWITGNGLPRSTPCP